MRPCTSSQDLTSHRRTTSSTGLCSCRQVGSSTLIASIQLVKGKVLQHQRVVDSQGGGELFCQSATSPHVKPFKQLRTNVCSPMLICTCVYRQSLSACNSRKINSHCMTAEIFSGSRPLIFQCFGATPKCNCERLPDHMQRLCKPLFSLASP